MSFIGQGGPAKTCQATILRREQMVDFTTAFTKNVSVSSVSSN